MEYGYDALIGFSANPEITWSHVSHDALGQKVSANATLEVCGTSVNVSWVMKKFGCAPMLLGAVGNDHFAPLVESRLNERQIKHRLLAFREQTCVASVELETQRLLSFKPQIVKVEKEPILAALDEFRPRFQVVTGLMNDDNEIQLAKYLLAEGFGTRVLNPRETLMADKRRLGSIVGFCDWLFLNRFEAAIYLGCSPLDVNLELIEPLLDLCSMVVVTCDGDGAMIAERQGLRLNMPSHKVGDKIDEKGAGDCFLGCFLSSICKGNDIKTSFELARIASGIKVTRPGTANIPTFQEVLDSAQVRV